MGKGQQATTELIGSIYEQSKNCHLDDDFFEKIDNDLDILSKYFKTNKIQAFLIANIIPLNFNDRSVGTRELIGYFNCSPMILMKYIPEIEALCKVGLLKKVRTNKNRMSSIYNDFIINENVLEAISLGKDIEFRNDTYYDIYQILQAIYELWIKVDDEELLAREAIVEIENIIDSNESIPLLQKLIILNLCIQDTYLFLILVWKTLMGADEVNLERTAEGLVDHNSSKVRYIRTFLAGENQLLKKDLVEVVNNNFSNEIELKLTENALAILEQCELKIYSTKNKKRSDVVNPEDIVSRKLIYNEEELKSILLIQELLQEENLVSTQDRLAQKSLSKFITIMFHGAPGTGKSETVFQIAKATGRQIMKVDISNAKSAFFGESEKKIKKIFTNYRAFANECSTTPILLFNEADAIFSKRKDIGSSNVAQTENSIQNIILEEMENLENGILIATTNLTNNLDSAFDRRFLFKVEFHKPNTSVKAQIWKLKLPNLSEPECQTLASQFDFSGGQIDNIVRKTEISEIINGRSVEFNQIICFCNEEVLGGNKHAKMGFLK